MILVSHHDLHLPQDLPVHVFICGSTRHDLLVVSAETVEGSMVLRDGIFRDKVGCPRRRLVGSCSGAAVGGCLLTVKASRSADKGGHLVVKHIFTSACIDSRQANLDHCCVALVEDLEKLASCDQVRRRGHRVLSNLEVLLAVKQHHGVEVGDDLVESECVVGGHEWANTVGRQNLEVLIAFAVE